MVWPLDDAVSLGEQFADIGLSDPISALLLALGAILIGFSSLVFGYLTVRGLVAAIIPPQLGRAPPRRD